MINLYKTLLNKWIQWLHVLEIERIKNKNIRKTNQRKIIFVFPQILYLLIQVNLKIYVLHTIQTQITKLKGLKSNPVMGADEAKVLENNRRQYDQI